MFYITVREARPYRNPTLTWYAQMLDRYLTGQKEFTPRDFAITLHTMQKHMRTIRDAGHASFVKVKGSSECYEAIFAEDAKLDVACREASNALLRVAQVLGTVERLTGKEVGHVPPHR